MKKIVLSVIAIFIIQVSSVHAMNSDDPIIQQNLKRDVDKILDRKKSELAALELKLQKAQTEQERNAIRQEIDSVKNRRDPMPPQMPNNS